MRFGIALSRSQQRPRSQTHQIERRNVAAVVLPETNDVAGLGEITRPSPVDEKLDESFTHTAREDPESGVGVGDERDAQIIDCLVPSTGASCFPGQIGDRDTEREGEHVVLLDVRFRPEKYLDRIVAWCTLCAYQHCAVGALSGDEPQMSPKDSARRSASTISSTNSSGSYIPSATRVLE